jgi:hypothetical protein
MYSLFKPSIIDVTEDSDACEYIMKLKLTEKTGFD